MDYVSFIGDNLYSEDKAEIRKIKKEGNSVVKGIKDSDYYKKYVKEVEPIQAIEKFNETVNPVAEITGVHKDAFTRNESKITGGHHERVSFSAICTKENS